MKKAATAIVKRPVGRPARYHFLLAAEILVRIAGGESLKRICQDPRLPSDTTVNEWVIDDVEGFAARYARARMIAAERIFEECLEIADNTEGDFRIVYDAKGTPSVMADHYHMNRARLMVDTRKFMLAKLYPRKFGEKAEQLALEEEQARLRAQQAGSAELPLRPQISREEWMKIHGIKTIEVPGERVG